MRLAIKLKDKWRQIVSQSDGKPVPKNPCQTTQFNATPTKSVTGLRILPHDEATMMQSLELLSLDWAVRGQCGRAESV